MLDSELHKDLETDRPVSVSGDEIIEHPAQAAPAEPIVNFPSIKRQVFDVLHDDDRNEVWIGIKLRMTVKGRTSQNGPIEDIEVNLDPMSAVVSLDSAKQELLMALGRDSQLLNEKRARQAALKAPSGESGSSILSRLGAGLGKAFAGKIH